MKTKKVKDLDQHLTQVTGLDKDERQEWRDCIAILMNRAKGEVDDAKRKWLKKEAMNVFDSFSYWKQNYQNKTIPSPLKRKSTHYWDNADPNGPTGHGDICHSDADSGL